MREPLSEEQIATLRIGAPPETDLLLDEIERLRKENMLLLTGKGFDSARIERWFAELREKDATIAAMRPIVEAVARHGMDAFGGRVGGPWVWKCPECGQTINAELHTPSGSVTGRHSKTCPVPPAVDMVMQWTAGEQARALLAEEDSNDG